MVMPASVVGTLLQTHRISHRLSRAVSLHSIILLLLYVFLLLLRHSFSGDRYIFISLSTLTDCIFICSLFGLRSGSRPAKLVTPTSVIHFNLQISPNSAIPQRIQRIRPRPEEGSFPFFYGARPFQL